MVLTPNMTQKVWPIHDTVANITSVIRMLPNNVIWGYSWWSSATRPIEPNVTLLHLSCTHPTGLHQPGHTDTTSAPSHHPQNLLLSQHWFTCLDLSKRNTILSLYLWLGGQLNYFKTTLPLQNFSPLNGCIQYFPHFLFSEKKYESV